MAKPPTPINGHSTPRLRAPRKDPPSLIPRDLATETFGPLEPANDQPYPDDNPKTRIGLTKPSMKAVPPVAMLELGAAMADGCVKYGLMNYREKTVSASVYYDAMMRHLFAWWDGENNASDSGVHHLGHVMACAAILMDADTVDKLNDDRPLPGAAADVIADRTKAKP